MYSLSLPRRLRNLALVAASVGIVVGYLQCKRAAAQPAADPEADSVCETLLNDYILRQAKIETADINAAIQLIASRGRGGYWRTVFKHFQECKVNDNSRFPSANLLAILTKMLYRDGLARWLMAHPDEAKGNAWFPIIVLSDDVLDTIMARAKQVDRNELDDYVVAVVAAHDKRSKDFLLEILNGNLGDASDNSRFHAAVGLANLGERAGVAWLVQHEGDSSLWKVSHYDVPSGNMLEARLHALSDVTGLPNQSLEQWQAWWKENPLPDSFAPKARVRLQYP